MIKKILKWFFPARFKFVYCPNCGNAGKYILTDESVSKGEIKTCVHCSHRSKIYRGRSLILGDMLRFEE